MAAAVHHDPQQTVIQYGAAGLALGDLDTAALGCAAANGGARFPQSSARSSLSAAVACLIRSCSRSSTAR